MIRLGGSFVRARRRALVLVFALHAIAVAIGATRGSSEEPQAHRAVEHVEHG
ncbi:MAG: hypothetical protein IT378_27240 [Sandaracinaceae bacterium]|nr:hypothetical protein [Sandaracinaceae bacterium]MCC6878037.1 hypothetical protein [Sandaracinaceae bacterium]